MRYRLLSRISRKHKEIGIGYQHWHSVRHADYDYFLSLREEIVGSGVKRSDGYMKRKQMFEHLSGCND